MPVSKARQGPTPLYLAVFFSENDPYFYIAGKTMLRKLSFLSIVLGVLLCLSPAFAQTDLATETSATPPPMEKEIINTPAIAPAKPAPAPTTSELIAAPAQTPVAPAEKVELKPGTIGTVIEVEGTATLTRADSNSTPVPVKTDDPVFINDVIQTGADSRVLVLFIDDSRLTLGSNAGFHVMEYAYDVAGARSHAYISVTDGPFMYADGKLARIPKPDVKFLAPDASIEFNGATAWAGMFEESYTVYTDSGEIVVETKRSRMRVPAGHGTHIDNVNAVPARPAAWEAAKVDEIIKTVSLKDLDHIRKRLEFHQSRNPLIAAQQIVPKVGTVPVPEAGANEPAKSGDSTRREVIVKSNNIKEQRQVITTSKPAPAIDSKTKTAAPKKDIPPIERTDSGIRLNAPETDAPKAETAQELEEQPFPAQPRVLGATSKDGSLPADPAKQQEALEKLRLEENSENEFAPAKDIPAQKPDAF